MITRGIFDIGGLRQAQHAIDISRVAGKIQPGN